MDDEGVGSEPAEGREQELEAQVESLVERIVDIVNAAEPAHRHTLREYAADLLKGGTEVLVDAQTAAKPAIRDEPSNPLGIALLLFVVGVVLVLPFRLMGLTLIAIAVALGLWGGLLLVVRR